MFGVTVLTGLTANLGENTGSGMFTHTTLKAIVSSALLIAPASAAVSLSFSGGNGSPIAITLAEPITYTIGNAPTTTGVFFVFRGLGDFPEYGVTSGSYSINGGPTIDLGIHYKASPSQGVLEPGDVYFFRSSGLDSVAVGDVVTLHAGTITTAWSSGGAPPADGDYETFLISNDPSNVISAAGSSVPEPSGLVLAGLGCAGLLRRRR